MIFLGALFAEKLQYALFAEIKYETRLLQNKTTVVVAEQAQITRADRLSRAQIATFKLIVRPDFMLAKIVLHHSRVVCI